MPILVIPIGVLFSFIGIIMLILLWLQLHRNEYIRLDVVYLQCVVVRLPVNKVPAFKAIHIQGVKRKKATFLFETLIKLYNFVG